MSLLTDFSQLDTSKFKRFFVIGCSFTEWYWPTWANIISRDNPHLEFHSFAKAGQGNAYISTILNQLTYTHNLCETDLVGVMWSTFHRIDYYTSGENLKEMIKNNDKGVPKRLTNWKMHSDCIHLQVDGGTKTEGFCDRGFLIRDLATIDTTSTVMEQAPYTAFQMYSVEPTMQLTYDQTFHNGSQDNSDVLEVYSHLNNKIITNTSLFNAMGNTFTKPTVSWTPAWVPEDSAEIEVDYHPSSLINCQFLQSNGYTISPSTLQHCAETDAKIQQTTWPGQLHKDKEYLYKVMYAEKEWPL